MCSIVEKIGFMAGFLRYDDKMKNRIVYAIHSTYTIEMQVKIDYGIFSYKFQPICSCLYRSVFVRLFKSDANEYFVTLDCWMGVQPEIQRYQI